MRIEVPLENGLLPDKYGKFAPPEFQHDGHAFVSFPIRIDEAPPGTKSFALTLLDWDSIPVGGFCWIHWAACDIPPETTEIPEGASAAGSLPMVQGKNSEWSPLLDGSKAPELTERYIGPRPPDRNHLYSLCVYALDCELGLEEGFFLNELIWAVHGHVLGTAMLHLESRA